MVHVRTAVTGFSIVCLLVASPALSAGKAKNKGHAAHEHGSAMLNLIAEGSKLTAQFIVPSEGIYGFEYEAKSAADRAKRDAGGEKLKNNFEKMVLIDASYGCVFKNTKLDLHVSEKGDSDHGAHGAKHGKGKAAEKAKGEHSETHADFVAECQKPLSGAKVSFAFGKYFSAVKEVKVQVLSGEKQSGADIDDDKGSVTL